MVKPSTPSNAQLGARATRPGWGWLHHAWVAFSCTFVLELQALLSKRHGSLLRGRGAADGWDRPQLDASDSSFLFIPAAQLGCLQADWGQEAGLTNAVAAAVLVVGHQVLAFTARPHVPSRPAVCPLPQLASGTGTGQFSDTVTVTPGHADLWAGQSRAARGQMENLPTILPTQRVKGGVLLGKDEVLMDVSIQGEGRCLFGWGSLGPHTCGDHIAPWAPQVSLLHLCNTFPWSCQAFNSVSLSSKHVQVGQLLIPDVFLWGGVVANRRQCEVVKRKDCFCKRVCLRKPT